MTLSYILRRILYMVFTLVFISIIVFFVIQLPPGDVITRMVTLKETGSLSPEVTQKVPEVIENLKEIYGLDQPMYIRYWRWVKEIITKGEFGFSFYYGRPVINILMERIPYTVLFSILSLFFTWIIAIPVGIYSAVKQYSIFDYFFTFSSFIGRSIPNFLLALVLMFLAYLLFGLSVGGLFSPEFRQAPWSIWKLLDLLGHLVIPIVVVGTAQTASMVRILRATTLDELGKDYVRTARAKGLKERVVILKHVVRISMNPIFSTVGWILPGLISGATITSVVMSLPTTGPVLLNALKNQDMYLGGSFLLLVSALTVIGTLLSDIVLAISDPRIRYE